MAMLKTSPPGEMDQPITLINVTQITDESGGIVYRKTDRTTSRPLWAKVERSQGTESVEADTPTARAKAKAEMRFVSGVTKDNMVRWQDVDWQIVDLDPVPREDRLFIYLERRGESGDGGAR